MQFIKEITMNLSTGFLFYIATVLIVTIVGFFLMGFDKYRAVKGKYRISELTLMAFAFFGGAVGILLGMVCFHHKIGKKKFYIGIPVLYVFNQIFYLIIYYRTLQL